VTVTTILKHKHRCSAVEYIKIADQRSADSFRTDRIPEDAFFFLHFVAALILVFSHSIPLTIEFQHPISFMYLTSLMLFASQILVPAILCSVTQIVYVI
jgi:hypothetical protein